MYIDIQSSLWKQWKQSEILLLSDFLGAVFLIFLGAWNKFVEPKWSDSVQK